MRPFVRFHMKAHNTNLSLDLNVKQWTLVTLHLVQLTSREVSATASCHRDDDRLSRLTVTIHLQLTYVELACRLREFRTRFPSST
jgi:hypothetical protein